MPRARLAPPLSPYSPILLSGKLVTNSSLSMFSLAIITLIPALQLARTRNLNPDRVDVENLVRGRFEITSLTTYRETSAAKEQADRLWEQSAIITAHRSGQIVYAA